MNIYIGVANILTELTLVVQPLVVTRSLKAKLHKKIIVFAVFAARIVYVYFFAFGSRFTLSMVIVLL